MSEKYIPLYRKYRPQTLDTLIGQEHVKKTLTSAIELGKIANAFLFTGPRGTGKTSTARILAKSLNCAEGPTIHPCGKCESCKNITNSIPIDVIEMDAASNRSVEDAQNIIEKIQYAPVNGKYKIYIIDEVHMLSSTAFNALLKTLEEPPENVIFILATTEVHKVLDTIKSRCQRFDFRRITTEDIVKHLRYISDQEKINITDDALYTIAKNSAGGMRDSISLLDQLSLLGVTNEVTSDDVNSILGRISFDVLHNLSDKIISSSPNEAIQILNEIYNSGNEPLQILTNLSEYFKNLLISKNCNKDLLSELTGLNEQQLEVLSNQKDKLETQQIVFLIERISYYIKEVKQASNQHLWLEVGMIDLANMTENTTLLDLQNRVKALESGEVSYTPNPVRHTVVQQSQQTVTRPAPVPPPHETQPAQTVKTEVQTPKTEAQTPKAEAPVVKTQSEDFTPPPMSKKSDGMDLQSLWDALLANISSVSTKAMLRQVGTPVKISSDEIIITFKTDNFVSQYANTSKKDLIAEAAKVLFNGADTKIIVRLPQPDDDKLQSGDVSISTPVNTAEEKKKEPIVTNLPLEDEPEEPLPIIPPPKKNEKKLDENDIKRLESDQEKMVLDLFNGKYVE